MEKLTARNLMSSIYDRDMADDPRHSKEGRDMKQFHSQQEYKAQLIQAMYEVEAARNAGKSALEIISAPEPTQEEIEQERQQARQILRTRGWDVDNVLADGWDIYTAEINTGIFDDDADAIQDAEREVDPDFYRGTIVADSADDAIQKYAAEHGAKRLEGHPAIISVLKPFEDSELEELHKITARRS